ncbi:replication endonuclease [Shewanella marisflavi]|uniref:replication endonuclease n=1 Tax=Shewanella marisflavi TaxID=260364 RepID=UPI003AABDAB2
MPNVHGHDKQWLSGKLHGLPSLHKKAIMQQYQKHSTRREANLYVLQTTKAIAKVLGKDCHFYSVNVEDRDHKRQAQYHARCCIKIAAASNGSLLNTYNRIIHYITGYQITPPKLSESVINNLKADTLNQTELAQVVGVLKRANDESWWKPKLRRQHNRQIETISRLLNQVNKHRGIYASNITVDNFKTQWQNNQELLENTIATNELDYSMSLAELSKLNVSNPAIRKAELMVRIRGFEDYAKQMGYSALFLTMTTPSKYHRSYSKSGDANPNWNGATPLDAQEYLNRIFQRIRASLNRDKITPFGFRIAEPHHDGTPHWHLLLFIPTEQQQALVDTFEQYCLEEDGDEQGAKQRRFKVEYIDPDKGSATGYVVKYVSKNIDGEGIDHDSYGKEAVTSAVRIKVWASCWGIRQFQQIGGVGVTQWRELRRLDIIKDKSLDWVEPIRKAADESNWSRYTELMGGVFCKRVDQLIRPLYGNANSLIAKNKQNPETIQQESRNCGNRPENSGITLSESGNPIPESIAAFPKLVSESAPESAENRYKATADPKHNRLELKTNRYGDALIKQLKGIVCLGVEIITRVHSWTISMTTKPKPLTWSSVNNCTTLVSESDTIPNLVTINLMPEDNRSAGKRRLNEIDLSTRYMSQTATRY